MRIAKNTRVVAVAAFLLALLVVLSLPVMAKEPAALTPPAIVKLAPVGLSPELREKYSEQTVVVKVRITISEAGLPDGELTVVTSSGDETFDQAVITAVKQSVFSPAYTAEHKAVASVVVLPMHVKVEKYVPEESAAPEAPQAE
ncbi:TonB family protein [Anaerospora hongkongensis]|uniref:TonB family protein n=1 Tax=Anaerospora hongkongensis TaxID=244830 RepID=UPI00289C64D8|nr:TonB family protein [Anaerospora hongkongensis]